MSKYTETVVAAKLAARDQLRAGQVKRRLEKVRNVKISLKNAEADIAKEQKRVSVIVFEANAVSDQHPLKAEKMENATKVQEDSNKYLADYLTPRKEAFEKEIADLEKEIAAIEAGDGTIKVDFDKMSAIADGLIAKKTEDDFLSGEYDDAAKAELADKAGKASKTA